VYFELDSTLRKKFSEITSQRHDEWKYTNRITGN
jgi:hypothetical protein